MYITLETDYAIRILHLLARRGEKTDAKTIAAETGVTFRFTLKILHRLVEGGFVKSYQGAKGGYHLEKSPQAITLLDIINLTEGSVSLSRCLTGDYPCTLDESHSGCKVQKAFSHITKVMERELSAYTLADLM